MSMNMLNYRSRKLYEDLKVLFQDDNQVIRKMLFSSLFTPQDIDVLRGVLGGRNKDFSNDFYACLEAAKRYFVPEKLANLFKILLEELEEEFEFPKCLVITTKRLEAAKMAEIEKVLQQKHGPLRFEYKISTEIISGIIFKIGNNYYDGSFRQILSEIKIKIRKEIM